MTNQGLPIPEIHLTTGALSSLSSPDQLRDDALADAHWLMRRYHSSEIQEHRGRYIAVAGKQLLGVGDDPLSLRQDAAKSHGLDPSRLFITYIDDPDAILSEESW